MTEEEFLKQYDASLYDIPLCTVDIAIFSLIKNKLNILTVKRDEYPFKGFLSLPGGFIRLNEDFSTNYSALRVLRQKTGLSNPYLEQVETIGSPIRDPRGWSMTVLYYSLVDYNDIDLEKLNDNSKWIPVENLKDMVLGFDHGDLIKRALARIKSKSTYTALPIELMPKKFTLSELQKVFELILERKLQDKAFRTRIQKAEMVIETEETKICGKRPAKLFVSAGINRDNYFSRSLAE